MRCVSVLDSQSQRKAQAKKVFGPGFAEIVRNIYVARTCIWNAKANGKPKPKTVLGRRLAEIVGNIHAWRVSGKAKAEAKTKIVSDGLPKLSVITSTHGTHLEKARSQSQKSSEATVCRTSATAPWLKLARTSKKPKTHSAPQQTTADNSAPQQTTAHHSEPQQTIADNSAPQRTAADQSKPRQNTEHQSRP